jgi:hypothetical protein
MRRRSAVKRVSARDRCPESTAGSGGSRAGTASQLPSASLTATRATWAKRLAWYSPWEQVLDARYAPSYSWFPGARTDTVLYALDRHQDKATRNKLALPWEGEGGEQRFSYHALEREVCRLARVLRSMGVEKGDVVTVYLPRIPELMKDPAAPAPGASVGRQGG